MTMLLSHASDDASEATWLRHDINVESCWHGVAESCWRRCCRGDLAAAQCRCQFMLATMLPSHTGDIDVESC
jgi:hypothetical protein